MTSSVLPTSISASPSRGANAFPATPPSPKVKDEQPIRGEWQRVTGRDVAALLDPRPTLVVGSVGRRDEVGMATIIWATPISHEPPMVAFSLRARSHTMGCIQKSKCFSLNVLPANEEGIYVCEQCGTRTGYQYNKITLVQHHMIDVEFDKTETVEVEVPGRGIFGKSSIEEAEKTTHLRASLPIIDAATSWMACSVDRIEEAGDHLLVIGSVIQAETCAVRNKSNLLIPQDVLQCVQHGCYAKVELLENK